MGRLVQDFCELLLLGIIIICLPILIPISFLIDRWQVSKYFRKTLEESWQCIITKWASSHCVTGSMTGFALAPTLDHRLAVEFARRYPTSQDFLREQLAHPNPYIAAYAFKALIRVTDLFIENIPLEILNRREKILQQQFGCIAETVSLGDFITQYFGAALTKDITDFC